MGEMESSERKKTPRMTRGMSLVPIDWTKKRELIPDIWGKRGATSGEKGACVGECKKNENRELIPDIWGKRGATYGEKGACVGE